MNDAQPLTVFYYNFTSHVELRWVRFAPLGVPFVSSCGCANKSALTPLLEAIEMRYGGKKLTDSYEFQLRGVIRKKRYSREERAAYHREYKWSLEGRNRLPAWEWQLGECEVLAVKKLHWAKDAWLNLPAVVCTVAYVAAFCYIMVAGAISCVRNW